ncbi:hypothetical protein B0A50_05267 [Salinomyces thailandicus]|uniref:Uncharacterized protein n=1 Tax=Salinomyces thailandicus TaxID=706561 RepID=A0A4U0TVN5_9PEZI|nr:hypothetical protein B0A50_05267 [Salinomyces thailandica]
MKSFATATITSSALWSVLQLCPAPVAVLDAVITGALSGEAGAIVGAGASGKFGKRDIETMSVKRADPSDPFAGLPQPAADECQSQLSGVTVNITPTGDGAFKIDNVPSACMTLSNVILGTDYGDQPVPTPPDGQ